MSLSAADAELLTCWVGADWTRAAQSVQTGTPDKPDFVGGAGGGEPSWNANHTRLWAQGPGGVTQHVLSWTAVTAWLRTWTPANRARLRQHYADFYALYLARDDEDTSRCWDSAENAARRDRYNARMDRGDWQLMNAAQAAAIALLRQQIVRDTAHQDGLFDLATP